jgi:capsular exopolysaccharide synthesis family protein
VVFLLVVAGTAAWSFTRTPVYSATAEVYVTIAPGKDGSTLNQDAQYVLAKVQSYTAIATTPTVLDPAAAALGAEGVTAASLSRSVTATNEDATTIIQIQASANTPALAADVANVVAAQLSPTIRQIEPSSNSSGIKASIVRRASAPTSPQFPRNDLNLVLGVLGGLLLGGGIAIAAARLDTSVRTADELEELTGAAPIGSVGFDRVFKKRPVIVDNPRSVLTEDYRTIRARLAFASVDTRIRKVVITSAVPGEGKSTVSTNLAVVLAQGGAKVCLVEGDVRRPKVAEYLGLDGAVGLTDVLIGAVELDAALVRWGDLLEVLPAGTNPPDPGELFATERMRELVDTLGDRFDYVILDTPPLLSVADAAIVSRLVDGTLLVSRAGRSRRAEISRVVELLRDSDTRLLGTILNGVVRTRRANAYEYYSAVERTTDQSVSKRRIAGRLRSALTKRPGTGEITLPQGR